MRLLITGVRGMLGQDLAVIARMGGCHVDGADLPELDITRDDGGWERLPEADWVIHGAAWTDVDGAEQQPDRTYAVNREGAGRMARWCAERGCRLLHISTDYVFDGLAGPYDEKGVPHPLGVYGQSKWEGEQAVMAACPEALIVRTQALYGRYGRNFVKAIHSRLVKGPWPLTVVQDHRTCPTYTVHLAEALLRLIGVGATGIINVSASGSCSWYEFACAIRTETGSTATVEPVPAIAYPRPARRPPNAVLLKDRYEQLTGARVPDWQEGLKAYVKAGIN